MPADKAYDNPPGKKRAGITPERFKKVRALFDSALGIAPDKQADWLHETCEGDSGLYREVEELLITDRRAGESNSLPSVLPGIKNTPEFPSMEGRRIDNYQVIREIGWGGMGVVYLARRADDLFSKRVALKILKPEKSDQDLDRRFRQERNIIARLDHPNIARLLDGGTTAEGLPYSVMEYVEGKPLDTYCDENGLNITERIKLFQTVCTAVQYAHQNLVVHRDLKPSNILVSNDGTVKLLDFGIAKLIAGDLQQDQTLVSNSIQAMTPAYASPEQTTGLPINTSTDVYSLGVILYELVTGRSPYRTKRRLLHEIVQAISEQTPVRPSEVVLQRVEEKDARFSAEQLSEIREGKPARLHRRLAGELDNIILMALRKEPQRRYSSVEQLNSDLSRHQSGMPVLAQKDTASYRMAKFIKRHRLGVSSAVLIVVLMVIAIGEISWYANKAHIAQNRAVDEARNARQQLRIAEERTREARQERDKADAIAQKASKASSAILADPNRGRSEAEELAAFLLSVNAPTPQRPGIAAAGVPKNSVSPGSGTNEAPLNWAFKNYENYDVRLEKKSDGAGAIACVRSKRPRTGESTELRQSLNAQSYIGKRVRFSAMLKLKDVEFAANLFARIDGKPPEMTIQKQSESSLKGTREWSRQMMEFPVPESSYEITIGLTLRGGGAVWIDDVNFYPIDRNPPDAPSGIKAPLNFGFEEDVR